MLFLTLKLEGHVPVPHKYLRQLSSRPCGSLPQRLQRVSGMEYVYPLLPLRWPLGSGFLISLAKILEPISGEAEHQAGPRDPGSML